ncbi:glycosyltransferase family 2 protein [Chitinimonas sp.]|uniref:glycosyltransferase family 2 protein n=1 Tax=Chitinimonas sp. TaxID=1934313 RepID=UPI002F950338
MSESSSERPLASLLLIAYRQADSIEDAIAGALAQTYSPLEIVLSDDASPDDTYARMQAAVAGYTGPHRIVLNRNPSNMGIGAHIDHVARLSHGEMLFVAAGDDISLPTRVERVMAAWEDSGRQLDLIASALVDIDEQGREHERICPDQLAAYRNAADWLAKPPYVIGAAQAWTRRLFDRFGGLPRGVMFEDLVMVFRAIVAGGARTLDAPLVRYRRGGFSAKQRSLSAEDVSRRLLRGARSALIEIPLLWDAARQSGQAAAVDTAFKAKLQREQYIHDILLAEGLGKKLGLFLGARGVPMAIRVRLLAYAAFPWLLAPWFAAKRWRARRKAARQANQ